MRYAKQPDMYSCGPVAILNALKWAGIPATTKVHLSYLQFSCQTFDLEKPSYESNGTEDKDLDRVLRYVGKGTFKVKRKRAPTLHLIEKHVKNGGSLCLGYDWQENGEKFGHYVFIESIQDGMFVTINDHMSQITGTINLRKPATIKEWVNGSPNQTYAWLLTKTNPA